MSINLSKGQKINLSKETNNGLSKVMVGLGWSEVQPAGGFLGLFKPKPADIDCDAFAVLLGPDGKLLNHTTAVKECCIFFNNLKLWNGSIQHMGDNLVGGAGDCEQIMVDLKSIPANIHGIVFAVNIYQALQKNQHFGMVQNAFIRVVDRDRNVELCRFNLNENYNNMTALIAGSLIRTPAGWEFQTDGRASRVESLLNIVGMYS